MQVLRSQWILLPKVILRNCREQGIRVEVVQTFWVLSYSVMDLSKTMWSFPRAILSFIESI